ncbi:MULTISPECIES: alpha/beta fold hydrolase [unclassified Actinotalea]|uniref:alpha/beta fold hydrolase n=1 Tax=unclassified Actinotalea TaxID=2638618 RepID=UPI0015F605A3|nr:MULTISPECIES: alpha/beta fold hydrolase [unclassified Actinotalea]
MDTFRRDGLTFDVHDHAPAGAPHGAAGSAPTGTAVLLHGFPQDASAYDAVVPLLTGAGLRVLAPDQRGYSPGARPAGRRAYAVRELVADVVALLDAAGVERAHVVGHDWGGAVAWSLAGRHPERTASLTVLSTPHPAAMAAGRGDQVRRSSYMLWFQAPKVPEALLLRRDAALLRRFLAGSGLEPHLVDHYATRMSEPGALTAALGWYRALPVSRSRGKGAAKSRGSGPTPVPTTYVSGRRDPFFAPDSVRATGRYVTGPYRHVELDADHWLPEHRPDDVAAAVLAHLR